MINTNVRTIARNIVEMTKGTNSIIVAFKENRVIIISEQKNHIHIPYVYDGANTNDAYQKYLHLIGKMILKDQDSKYFGCPILDEHCKNGHPGNVSESIWVDLANSIMNEAILIAYKDQTNL